MVHVQLVSKLYRLYFDHYLSFHLYFCSVPASVTSSLNHCNRLLNYFPATVLFSTLLLELTFEDICKPSKHVIPLPLLPALKSYAVGNRFSCYIAFLCLYHLIFSSAPPFVEHSLPSKSQILSLKIPSRTFQSLEVILSLVFALYCRYYCMFHSQPCSLDCDQLEGIDVSLFICMFKNSALCLSCYRASVNAEYTCFLIPSVSLSIRWD